MRHIMTQPEAVEVSTPTRQRRKPPAHPAAFTYTVDDACALSGLGRTTLYELMKSGELATRVVAGRRLIDADALRALVTRSK